MDRATYVSFPTISTACAMRSDALGVVTIRHAVFG
jgi:hypothetical protein